MKQPLRIWQVCLAILIAHLLPIQSVAQTVKLWGNPSTPSNSIVFEFDGKAYAEWVWFTNPIAPPLDRKSLTNVLANYCAALMTTNFELFASLYDPSCAPTNKDESGTLPTSMQLKGCYLYGTFTLADVRLGLSINGAQRSYDTLLWLSTSNSDYYLTTNAESPLLCLLNTEYNNDAISNGNGMVANMPTKSGYLTWTNHLVEAKANPCIVYIPGKSATKINVTTNSVVGKDLSQIENVAAAALQSLMANDTNSYLNLILPDDLNHHSAFYRQTPKEYVLENWDVAREFAGQQIRLNEVVNLGDCAYVTFNLLDTNNVPRFKDWLFLKPFKQEWRISDRHNEHGKATVLAYLLDTCTQYTPIWPKILPNE